MIGRIQIPNKPNICQPHVCARVWSKTQDTSQDPNRNISTQGQIYSRNKGAEKTVETLRNVCHQQRRPKPNIEAKTPTKNIPLQGQDYLRNKGVEDPF